MYLLLLILGIVFIFAVLINWKTYRQDKFQGIFGIFMVMIFVGGFGASMASMLTREFTADEVEVRVPIVQMDGRYLHNGTTGENNNPITIYHTKNEGGTVYKNWQYSGSTGIRETNGEAYAYMTCPDASTAWSWTLFPWEDPEPNCDYEFVTFYIPEGES